MNFSKRCHFPAVPSSLLLFSPKSQSSQPSLSPHAFPRHLLQQGDLLPTPTTAYSFSMLQGEAACRERHRAGYWQTCHFRHSQKASVLSRKWEVKAAATPVPPQCRRKPSRDVPACSGQNGHPWKWTGKSFPCSSTSPGFFAVVTDFGRVSSRQRAPSLIRQPRRGLPRRWSAELKPMIFKLP